MHCDVMQVLLLLLLLYCDIAEFAGLNANRILSWRRTQKTTNSTYACAENLPHAYVSLNALPEWKQVRERSLFLNAKYHNHNHLFGSSSI